MTEFTTLELTLGALCAIMFVFMHGYRSKVRSMLYLMNVMFKDAEVFKKVQKGYLEAERQREGA